MGGMMNRDAGDIVHRLSDACTYLGDPRELERLCGNALWEIVRLREEIARMNQDEKRDAIAEMDSNA